MTRKLLYGTVRDRPRKVIHVVCVDAILEFPEIDAVAEKLRAHILPRYGEHRPNIVIVHGNTRESLRLFGGLHAVTRVRTALFKVAVTFSPLKLDVTARSWEAR
jgi:hypothetical protein